MNGRCGVGVVALARNDGRTAMFTRRTAMHAALRVSANTYVLAPFMAMNQPALGGFPSPCTTSRWLQNAPARGLLHSRSSLLQSRYLSREQSPPSSDSTRRPPITFGWFIHPLAPLGETCRSAESSLLATGRRGCLYTLAHPCVLALQPPTWRGWCFHPPRKCDSSRSTRSISTQTDTSFRLRVPSFAPAATLGR